MQQDKIKLKYNTVQITQQKEHFSNMFKIVNGQFNDKLFEGLGLPKIKEQDGELDQRKFMLKNLKQLNNNIILTPQQSSKQNTITGLYLPPPSFDNVDPTKAVIAYRYSIQITRQQIFNLRKFDVNENLIEFFLSFLEEYQEQKNTEQIRKIHKLTIGQMSPKLYGELYRSRHLGSSDVIDLEFDKEYLQKYDQIIFPIQAGFMKEFQLVQLLVKDKKLIHYHLCEIPYKQYGSMKQQIQKEWEFNNNEIMEKENLTESRRKQQDQVVQLILLWIKCTSQHFELKQMGNMKLWKIKLLNITKVSESKQSGFYLLILCSLLHFGHSIELLDDRLLKVLTGMEQLIEYVISSVGVGLNKLNPAMIKYFEQEMQNVIQVIS